MAFCSKCGTQLNNGERFCPVCGSPVGNMAHQAYQGNANWGNPSPRNPQPQRAPRPAAYQPQ